MDRSVLFITRLLASLCGMKRNLLIKYILIDGRVFLDPVTPSYYCILIQYSESTQRILHQWLASINKSNALRKLPPTADSLLFFLTITPRLSSNLIDVKILFQNLRS